jgi:D-alanyl-D-alanine carboxypeptidase
MKLPNRIAVRRRLWASGIAALIVISLVVVAKLQGLLRPQTLPPPTGPYPIGRISFHWIDASRQEVTNNSTAPRELLVYLWYPAERTATGPPAPYFPEHHGLARALGEEALKREFGAAYSAMTGPMPTHAMADANVSSLRRRYPVLLFSHGLEEKSGFYTALIEELASHGYVVAAVEHPYDALGVVFPDGRVVPFNQKKWRKQRPRPVDLGWESVQEAVLAKDILFVLDQLEKLASSKAGGPFAGRLDLTHVGAMGHSLGGKGIARAGAMDKRLSACVNLDGWSGGSPMGSDTRDSSPQQPFMMLAGSHTGADYPPGPRRVKSLCRTENFFQRVKSGSYWVTVTGLQHMDVTDLPLLSSTLNPFTAAARRRKLQIVRAYLRAFFDQYLMDKPCALLNGRSNEYPEVVVQRFGPAQHSTAAPPLGTPVSRIMTKVDGYIDAELQRQHIAGLSLAVLKEGEVIQARGYGLADVGRHIPATKDTVYQIASMTKQFTASAIMLLVEAGKVKLDDSIATYLTGLPAAWNAVTVRQLLTHTSGIRNFQEAGGYSLYGAYSPEDLIRLAASLPLAFQPGEKWSYSNTGYILLGEIIQQRSGSPYAEFLSGRILKPLRMTSTRMIEGRATPAHLATGYSWEEGTWKAVRMQASPTAAGGLASTVLDLAKWYAALDVPLPLRPSSLAQMWTRGRINDGSRVPYGFGWFVGAMNGHRAIEHSGDRPGFNGAITHFVDDRLTVIVLTNTEGKHVNAIAKEVAGLYLPAVVSTAR